jgi:hypothetical protein
MKLVRVVFRESMPLYPSRQQDGMFLVKLYICHSANSWYNAVNQRFQLQYHTDSKLQSPLSTTETQPICSSTTLINYADCHKISVFQKWVNLTHQDTFIHSPFEFSSASGCKTQDCVSQTDWNILKSHCNIFYNPLPRFNIPSYSSHVDCRAHVLFHDAVIAHQLLLTTSHASDP